MLMHSLIHLRAQSSSCAIEVTGLPIHATKADIMAWPAHSVNEGGKGGLFGGAILLGGGAVALYMYYNKSLPEHSGQTSDKVGWQQYSGPTESNKDQYKDKGPTQSTKQHDKGM